MLTINAVRIANSFLWIFEVKLKLGRDAYRGSTEKSCIILRARKLPQWLKYLLLFQKIHDLGFL